MNTYDVIVIGAGNGGLIGALTLAKAGKKVLMLERHNIPGGCATSFIRGRFEFETALHQLSSVNNGAVGMILAKLGVMDKVQLVKQKELYHFAIPEKVDITLLPDKDQMSEELSKHFPEEKEAIRKYMDFMMKFGASAEKVSVKRLDQFTPQNFPDLFEYAFESTQEVLDRYFKNDYLKAVLAVYWEYLAVIPSRLPFGLHAMMYYNYIEGKCHHIRGCSQALSSATLDEFEACGGDVRFNSEVVKIMVDEGQVKGVVTESGTEYHANYILSNASMITTYVDMIEEGKVPQQVFENMKVSKPGYSIFGVYLGLNCPPEEVGIKHGTNFYQTELYAEELEKDAIGFHMPRMAGMTCYNIDDPAFSPEGTCVINIVTYQRKEEWEKLPPQKYYEAKYEHAERVLDFISKFHPNIREHVEEIEISTPLTHMRYLGHPGGAVYGFEDEGKDFIANKLNAISPIKGLYFGSSWIFMGGFGASMSMGYTAAGLMLGAIKSKGE